MNPLPNEADREQWLELTQCLLDSFRRWTKRDLIVRQSPTDDLLCLWNAPTVVVFHGTQSDPVFMYGNRKALELWELCLQEFLGMPSRMTAEPVHRNERERLLQRTLEHGYVDDYRGVRISKTGNRFMIEQAVVWNVLDPSENRIGQAAAFDRWTML